MRFLGSPFSLPPFLIGTENLYLPGNCRGRRRMLSLGAWLTMILLLFWPLLMPISLPATLSWVSCGTPVVFSGLVFPPGLSLRGSFKSAVQHGSQNLPQSIFTLSWFLCFEIGIFLMFLSNAHPSHSRTGWLQLSGAVVLSCTFRHHWCVSTVYCSLCISSARFSSIWVVH